MAKSRSPGKLSSPSLRADDTAALIALKDLTHSKRVRTLADALGIDSKLHLVGGAVRDILCGLPAGDIDLATALAPQVVADRLHKAQIRVIETGLQHGTLSALIDEETIEITSFRTPGSRESHRLSDSIETDLGGRDFTINAIAFSLADESVIDPFHGVDDLRGGNLRCVESADRRFDEDPLRIMRMVRFGPAQGRTVDAETLRSATARVQALLNVSPERIRVELEHILVSPHTRTALKLMLESGILPVILPELMPSVGFEQNDFHHEDVFEHTLTVTERSVADLTVRLAALFHDVGKPATLTVDEEGHRHFYKHELESESMAVAAMERLKFSNAKIAAVRSLVKHHMRPIECGPSGVRRLLRDLDENFAQWRELKIADAPPLMPEPEFRQHLSDFDTMVETERTRRKGAVHEGLAIDGNDLMALGMAAGRPMGELLKALAEHVIENPDDNDREILLEKARRSISGPTQ